MTPADLDLAAAIRQLLRHPLVRAEIWAIVGELAPAAGRPEAPFSTQEAARRAGVAVDTILAHIASGDLVATKPPGSKAWRIRPADLDAFLSGGGRNMSAQPLHPPAVDLGAKRTERAQQLAEAVRKDRR